MPVGGEAPEGVRRVHQVITCPFFEGREYDENYHMGHAAEDVIGEVLERHGFRPQAEFTWGRVQGHIDFYRQVRGRAEVVEVKNTGAMTYQHLLQVALYKALVHAVTGLPTLGFLIYTKFHKVIGDSPRTPEWVHDLEFVYIHLPIESGANYIHWADFRALYKKPIAGPYCIRCLKKDCPARRAVVREYQTK
jgi:hypothetical protein